MLTRASSTPDGTGEARALSRMLKVVLAIVVGILVVKALPFVVAIFLALVMAVGAGLS